MGIPVVIATNGMGIPVHAVDAGAPTMTVATGGFGCPIVLSDTGAPFIVEGADDGNLLAGIDWTQGTNTTMTVGVDRVRAAFNGGNVRVYKHVTGLTNGATYRAIGSLYQGNSVDTLYYFRVSATVDLPDGGIYQEIFSGSQGDVDASFVMTGTELYIGIVGVVTDGIYVEIDEYFRLELV